MSTSSFGPEAILESARSIRPYLPELTGVGADCVDRQLAELLAKANAGESVHIEILDLLKSDPATRAWTAEFLSPQPVSKGFVRLPGNSGAVAAQKYACPQGDYIWYRRSVSIPIPVCPTHHELVLLEEE